MRFSKKVRSKRMLHPSDVALDSGGESHAAIVEYRTIDWRTVARPVRVGEEGLNCRSRLLLYANFLQVYQQAYDQEKVDYDVLLRAYKQTPAYVKFEQEKARRTLITSM